MTWIYDHLISLITSLISTMSVLYTTFRPTYIKWQKDRKINLKKHEAFNEFLSATDEIEKMFAFRRRNVVRGLNIQLNKFKIFTEQNFQPEVRLKFGEYLLENQDIMVHFIKMYAAKRFISNKQKVWDILTVVKTYLQRMPKLLQTLNNLNGDLDIYEKRILAEKKDEYIINK